MELTNLLNEAISSIQNLEDYYVNQIDNVTEQVKEKVKRYKYGIILEKFFFSKAIDSEEIEITKEEQEIIDEVLRSYSVDKNDEGLTIQYKLNNQKDLEREYELNIKKAHMEYSKLIERPQILNDSTLILLLVKYEDAISGIWRYIINKFPDAYLKNKSITYAELINLDSELRDIKKKFLDKEVEEIMRQPIGQWYQCLETKHNAKFDFNKEFDAFKEIYYRRNLIVHNQGIVNEVYISSMGNERECGERLEIDKEYLLKAFIITEIVIYGTFFGLRKISSKQEEVLKSLFELGFNHMLNGEWQLSEYVYRILMMEKNQSEADILCTTINYWISIKNQGRFDEIKDEIDKFDVSARSMQFKVAKCALLDDFPRVTQYLEESLEKEILASSIEQWPLFIQYRQSSYYEEFRKNHSQIFEIQGYQPEYVGNSEDEIIEEFGENMEELCNHKEQNEEAFQEK